MRAGEGGTMPRHYSVPDIERQSFRGGGLRHPAVFFTFFLDKTEIFNTFAKPSFLYFFGKLNVVDPSRGITFASPI